MESRTRASPNQFAILIEFMESNGDIARTQQGIQGRMKADRLWVQLTELLNSSGGGVIKSLDKWKKVWADWKTKTKKKALIIRRQAPFTRHALTATEERVLSIMGQAGIDERGSEELPSDKAFPPHTKNINVSRNIATQEIMMDCIPIKGSLSSNGKTDSPTPSQPSSCNEQPPEQTRSLIPPQRRRLPRYGLATTSQFLAVEQRRMRLEEERERNTHKREMEKLRLESKRIEMEERRNEIFHRLATIADNLSQIITQLRPPLSGAPSNSK